MITVLVTGASGIVGYGCLKTLFKLKKYKLVATSIYDSPVARKYCDFFEIAPNTMEACYFQWLKEIVERYKIDLLIPGIELDMFMWNQHRTELNDIRAKILINNPALIELCGDKWKFYQKLQKIGNDYCIPSIISDDFMHIDKEFGTPFIMKPRRGYGSKGIEKIYDQKDFDYFLEKYKEKVMFQKLIRGKEYTIGTFFDFNHELKAYIAMERKLSSGGYTEEAQIVEIEGIKSILQMLGKQFQVEGIANFQFIEDEGKLKLLEINPRISSSTAIREAFGYNECEMGVQLYMNNVIPEQPKLMHGKANRYIEELIVYDRNYF